MANKTLNQKLKDLVPYVVSDDNFEAVVDAAKEVRENLANDSEYQRLVTAVANYEHGKFLENKAYKEYSLLNATSLLRAARKQIKDCTNVPTDYENSEEFAKLVEKETKVLDTDARLVSFVESVINRFDTPKVAKTLEKTPYTFGEIRQFVVLINSGLLDREETRRRIAKGKPKARARR